MGGVINKELENHMPYLRKVVWNVCKDNQLLDDIAQECCIQIMKSEKNWDGNKKKAKQWIAAIARYTTLKQVKKENYEKIMKVEFDENQYAMKEKEVVILEEHVRFVLQQYGALSLKQKEILEMRYFKKMKLEQIGQQLGITHQAASSQIKTALTQLQGRARKMGLLSFVLCPWKWRWKSLAQALVHNSLVEVVSVMFVLGAVGFMGYKGMKFYGSSSLIRTPLAKEIVEEEKIEALILQLDDEDFDKREAATKALIAIGANALAELEKVKSPGNSAEMKFRIEYVLKKIKWNIRHAEIVKKVRSKKEWKEYAEKNIMVVKTAKELEEKLGSNRVIVIENNKNAIDLTSIAKTDPSTEHSLTTLYLNKLSNLVIIGLSDKPLNIFTTERFDDVIVLDHCENVIFENLEFGHQVHKGHCGGGVFVANESKKISFKKCEFFGCGTFGLELNDCEEVTLKDSIVRECTYDAVRILSSRKVMFSKCKIYNNEKFNVFMIFESRVEFDKCEVTNNYGEVLFDLFGATVTFNKGLVKGNRVKDFYDKAKEEEVDFKGTDVKNNSMDVVLKEWKWVENRNNSK